MKLTSPTGKSRRGGSSGTARTPTVEPGFRNPNHQVVVRRTGARSAVRAGQVVYELRCEACGHRYGCNGLDVKERKCPGCSGGVKGEALREEQPGLFQVT